MPTVNGRQVNGPAVIARRWALRGAALCPAGKDKYTSAAFSAAAENEPVTVTITRNAMANATEPSHQSAVPESFWAGLLSLLSLRPKSAAADATGSASAAAATALRPESAAADATGSASAAAATGATGSASAAVATALTIGSPAWLHAEGARFLEKFGAAGARWFAEGLSYGEAQDRYAAALAEENEALETRMAGAAGRGRRRRPTELRRRAAAFQRGGRHRCRLARPDRCPAPLRQNLGRHARLCAAEGVKVRRTRRVR